ncbi:MAG: hypothetical protein K1X89_28300 [Myxococcaceae bacterium]|nr:hypothetical protein [Myxococcaceae bacterium]
MRTVKGVVTLALLGAGLAFGAGKQPTEFKAPRQMSDEELAQAKARSRGNDMHAFDEKMQEPPKDPPYMLIGLCLIALLVATPFAARAYQRTTREISGADSAYASDSPGQD